ncbi:hypothetical protein LXA43DRAFT_1064064 [Ganoderma leucocontextum]|nr:hypothetical protein LXA43DRAFT_1064064 [Ganoderma leucocontextum]
MLLPDEAHREIDNLASLILPALEEHLKVDVGLIEENVHTPKLQVTDLRRQLISIAEKVDLSNTWRRPWVRLPQTKLGEVFSRTYHRLQTQERRREAAVCRATANETHVRAIALDDAYSRVQAEPNASFARTLLSLRIRSLVEDTRIEFEDAAAAVEQYEENMGESVGTVSESLQEERESREQTEEAAHAEQEGQEAGEAE